MVDFKINIQKNKWYTLLRMHVRSIGIVVCVVTSSIFAYNSHNGTQQLASALQEKIYVQANIHNSADAPSHTNTTLVQKIIHELASWVY